MFEFICAPLTVLQLHISILLQLYYHAGSLLTYLGMKYQAKVPASLHIPVSYGNRNLFLLFQLNSNHDNSALVCALLMCRVDVL